MATPSFFSRAHRPGVRAPKKIHGFLALPGETRNQIYNYYFDSERRCEIAGKGTQFTQRKPHTFKLSSNPISTNNAISASHFESNPVPPTVVRFSGPLGKYNAVQGLQTNWKGSLSALSLVCKQVYTETATFLYQKTVFVFDAPKRMDNFFKFASSNQMGSITRLHLHYNSYGNPKTRVNLTWQDKHRQSWQRACRSASKMLTGLRELEIWMQIHDSAPKFSLREDWLKPLLQFRRLSCPKELRSHNAASNPLVGRQSGCQIVKVHVWTRWTRNFELVWAHNRRLIEASRDLHLLYGQAIGLAITGSTEEAAMAGFNAAWNEKYTEWRHHLRFAQTGW